MYAAPVVLSIGLGCSRLGSASSGLDAAGAHRLLKHALEAGINVFDTADIYGQGDSERYLGAAIRAHGRPRGSHITIVTKGGQRFTPAQQMVALAKTPLRRLAGLMPSVRRGIATQRARSLPRDYSPHYIRQAIDRSLRRLAVDQIDFYLLHSPSEEAIERGDAFTMLDDLTAAGKLGAWGISCDDAASVRAACRITSVKALQVPLTIAGSLRAELADAASRGVVLFLRQIYAGRHNDELTRRAALAAAAAVPGAIALVGTTSIPHLDEALAAVRLVGAGTKVA